MSAFCTSCGTPRDGEARFCLACGTAFAPPVLSAPVPSAPAPASFLPASVPSRSKTPLIAGAAAAVVLLGGGAALALHHHGSTTTAAIRPAAKVVSAPAGPSAAQVAASRALAAKRAAVVRLRKDQASKIVSIVQASAMARTHVVDGVAKVQSCGDVEGGAALLAQAVGERSAVLARLASVDVSALPNGSNMVAALEEAQNDSLRADQAFRGWANDASDSCYDTPTAFHDDAYLAGVSASAAANASKTKFLGYWNPVVALTGVRAFTASEI